MIEQHAKLYAAHTSATHYTITAVPSFWQCSLMKSGIRIETEFNFMQGASPCHDCAHVECEGGALYRSGNFFLTFFEGCNFCQVSHSVLKQWKVQNTPIVACQYTRVPESILVTLKMPIIESNRVVLVDFQCQFVHRVFRFKADIFFRSSVSSVSVHPVVKTDHDPPLYSEPIDCVNSCYTGTFCGNFSNKNIANRYRVPSGACGMEFAFQFPTGNINVYRGGSRRRVTCKAFSSLGDVVSAMNTVCRRTGTACESEVKMHMLVLDGRCGRKIDVNHGGFFSSYIHTVFQNTDFELTNIIQELNVHVTVKWSNLEKLARVVLPSSYIGTDTHALLRTINMTLTCTRYASCPVKYDTNTRWSFFREHSMLRDCF